MAEAFTAEQVRAFGTFFSTIVFLITLLIRIKRFLGPII
ncbi:hypothetical protein Psch_03109 [Pelotomaculum schinkii]|uniref:Uncharacterized protein n=1 Tax=Pelotomaculum schinkii TaxID=78350 RepID=A0A4Y7RCM2_9FIRM|nr:hypothetical protein Psch_03109 [Pelotomaculum schinkii]